MRLEPHMQEAAEMLTTWVTTCPSCGTVFRIAKEQLQASEGWVRCGHCLEVFDGRHKLQQRTLSKSKDLSSTPSAKPQTQTPSGMQDAAKRADELDLYDQTDSWRTDLTDGDPPATQSHLSFVSAAKRHAFWGRTSTRLALIVLVVLSALMLTAQWLRESSSSGQESTGYVKTWINDSCKWLACKERPIRKIEAWSIESSSFQKDKSLGTNTMRLVSVLKNTTSAALVIPHLELSLTDAQGSLQHRLVIDPVALYGQSSSLALWHQNAPNAKHAERPYEELRLAFAIDTTKTTAEIAGYKLILFYP